MNEEKKKIIVGLFTPYLSENMGERFDEEYIKMQIEDFGYQRSNFNGTKHILTDKYEVRLDKPHDFISRGPNDLVLSIHGSTENGEEDVRGLRGSGLIMARFSIFYGGPSQYTGNYPEESGYALDFPKDIGAVKALLTNDQMLDALVLREETKIRDAVENLNSTLNQPVLITDYLTKALRNEK